MNYIVFDLEWNQTINQNNKNKTDALQFEIIEVGAVMLDEDFNEISRYSSLIKPVLHQKIHPIIKEITKITDEELQTQRDFKTVISEFFQWCGEDYVLCTYGNQDLMELQNNLEYHGINCMELGIRWSYPMMYIDVQKIFGLAQNENNEQRSLESAVIQLNLVQDKDFHRALEDAIYTAGILRKMERDLIFGNYSLDYYRIPETRQEEKEIKISGHNEFISTGYDCKEMLLEQPYLYVTRCVICDKKCRKKIKWFADNSKYICVSVCPEHGIMEGTIHVKHNKIRDVYYAIRKVGLINDEELENIILKKENIKERRRQKRQRDKNKKLL
ncbi:MAG: exonuclease domain-containing protein [Lachnospiraceae bacterium]|nr:exonuclease domain-containing protein [Lachnospiraceae bacterium]